MPGSQGPRPKAQRSTLLPVNDRLFAPGDRVLAAVSGGADSLAMLHALRARREELGIELVAVHVHHGLRGEEADADVDFLRRVCGEWSIPLIVEREDVPALAAARRISIEEAGRIARYDAFARAAAEAEANKVATAHTADDQAETVLLNLFRGAGIDGLAGIPERRGVTAEGSPPERGGRRQKAEGGRQKAESSGQQPAVSRQRPAASAQQPGVIRQAAGSERQVEVVRPILGAWRRHTEAYCCCHGLEPREDPSNRDLRYRRNRIRRELLPLLEQFEPGIKERLVRLSRQAREEAELLNAEAAALLRSAGAASGLCAGILAAAPGSLLRRALRLALREAAGFEVEVDAALLERLGELVRQPAGAVDLPGVPLRARREGELLLFESQRPKPAAVPPPEPVALPGATAAPGFGLRLLLEEGPAPREFRLPPDQALFDRDLLRPPLVLRGPEPGERFRPFNAPGSTLLSDLFTNRKVPRERRRSWPVLADTEGIVWVVGIAVADRVKITPATRRVVHASALYD